ncbi:hypothetical protein BDZ94DRAFT_1264504 [Collybia nuda]|uniref:Protein kinase domain-containing protein n=1 Tax=Collybia nuda TaxID=64659 RepID=A0A9P5Y0J9_9AGAR|nr:hypothetical protein BDZ94DRAFT_1264504 [Collybia nuda]
MTPILHGAESPAPYHTTISAPLQENNPGPDFVDEFFTYRPKTLYKAKNHTLSNGTRTPAFFDRHLDPQLQLLQVAYLPSITTDLMNIADSALETARSVGAVPPLNDDFPTQLVRDSIPLHIAQKIVAEQQIEAIYKKTTAKFCSRVAATLEFQLPTWEPGHLEFTRTSNKSRGIADGFLTLTKTSRESSTPALSERYNSVVDTFPTLAVWEFKSLTSGTLDVMEAIVQQTVSCLAFSWEGCEHGKNCIVMHTGKDGLSMITGNRMGLDAEPPICPSVVNTAPMTPNGPSISLSNHARKSARHITQQTWSEAVQEDVTFVIINAGNLEVIGIRDRKSRTLFLSDIIKVDDCDYGRLHTGLYIAILRDAVNRTLQLKPPNIPTSWTKLYGQPTMKKLSPTDIISQVCQRDWLVMTSSSRKTSLTGFKLNKFHFRGDPSKPLNDNTLADLRSFFRVTLSLELGHFIARGTLEVDGNRLKMPTKAIIVKIAHTDDAITKLRGEHEIYLELLKAGVSDLPRIIGFFHYVDIEESEVAPLHCAVLVMQDMGSPVCHVPHELTREHVTLFQNLLRKIHQAGIVHTKLSRENLLICEGNPARISIVSYGSAQKVGQDQKAVFDAEDKHLLELLPSAQKRGADGGYTKSFQDAFPTASTQADRVSESLTSESSSRKKGRQRTHYPSKASPIHTIK